MSSVPTPHLRLVGLDDSEALVEWLARRKARQDVANENRRAGQNRALSPTDPRWVLAVRAYGQLQGSTLTPERRERVMRTARQLGVRPFDANVIVAVVQDHARRGVDLGAAEGTLALLKSPQRRPGRFILLRWAAAVIASLAANALLVWWLLST